MFLAILAYSSLGVNSASLECPKSVKLSSDSHVTREQRQTEEITIANKRIKAIQSPGISLREGLCVMGGEPYPTLLAPTCCLLKSTDGHSKPGSRLPIAFCTDLCVESSDVK